jgi:hypothetical protein
MPLIRLAAVSQQALETDKAIVEASGGGGPHKENTATAAAATPPASVSIGWVGVSYLVIAAGAGLGIVLWWLRNPAPFTPASGISVFAPLYILAQAIERVIEPFTSLIPSKAPDDKGKDKNDHPIAKGTSVRKDVAAHNVNLALVDGDAKQASDWQATVDQIRENTAVIAWTTASVLGMALCGLFGLFMLRLVGFTDVPKQIDIIISGIAVGSGTKPLHDLISNLQEAKNEKQDPSEKKAA